MLPLAVFIIMSWGQNKHTKALFTGFSLLLIILCSSSSLYLLVMLDYCLKPISSSLLQAWYIKLNVAWIYYFGWNLNINLNYMDFRELVCTVGYNNNYIWQVVRNQDSFSPSLTQLGQRQSQEPTSVYDLLVCLLYYYVSYY